MTVDQSRDFYFQISLLFVLPSAMLSCICKLIQRYWVSNAAFVAEKSLKKRYSIFLCV